jgi:hypothetical protein
MYMFYYPAAIPTAAPTVAPTPTAIAPNAAELFIIEL